MSPEKPHIHLDDLDKVHRQGEIIIDDEAPRVGEDVPPPESTVDVDAMLEAMSKTSGQDLKAKDFPKKKAA